ncbi:signal peptidase II [Stieleria varia]|uniref:Lipoprotein signal peptidase n=1 Tax=Stieleria varia TaxID=2528005 RepID=A0A5C6AMA4_9BACT|nr:signal peptidase II [Stieleria varia]TWU00790.1 Lipoprotein signal peptidase [Stieleria varia]
MDASDRPEESSDRSHNVPPVADEASLLGRAAVYFTLAITGAALDLWSKHFVFATRGIPGQKDIWWVIEPYFGIETAVNPGALFGMGAGKGTVFAAMSVFALVGILVWLFRFRAAHSLWLTVALGLVTGGIIGNLYDRLGFWWTPDYPQSWSSGVRDWILWRINEKWTWPNFNIADSLLVVGAGMLLYQSVFPGQFGLTTDPQATDPQAEPSETTNDAESS